ncbi:MAG TPA: isoprenylcysteine carboxylmethyltransferase family protein [Cyclobacteriaceae bacterium]|nr:isoprenylcysteine carboxylmethyltransferase family protein [Cyclobacteriaceae bacterium]
MVKIGNFLFHYRNVLLPVFFLLILVPAPELFQNPTIALVIGLGISIAGQLIRFITIGLVYIIRGGQNRKVYAQDLVTTGIFSHCRNPLYVGNIAVGIGMGVASNSLLFFSVITPLIIFTYIAIVAAEENFLRGKFGPAYDEYAKDVNRWLPNLKGISNTFMAHQFNWKRVLLKEYNSTFTGTLLGIMLIMKANYEHPELYGDFQQKLMMFGIIILTVTAVYLFTKFLKKTHRLVAD